MMIKWTAKLRHRVTLQTKSSVPDGGGGFTIVWSDLAVVFADVEPLSGRERYAAERIEPVVTHRVTIRYRSDVDTTMRAMFGARYLYINSAIDPGERTRYLQLGCTEGAE